MEPTKLIFCQVVIIALWTKIVHCSTVIDIKGYGKITGVKNIRDGFSAFYGIPYAEPPVGQNRWREPVAKQPWKIAINATNTKVLPCVQPLYDRKSGKIKGSYGVEDCLKLNIWTPGVAENLMKPYPVMFWIHGGSYISGGISTSATFYRGENLLRRSRMNVVVVTVQYRLNIFGFLGSEILRNRTKNKSTGNFGIQDQRSALRWVKQHISAFGGDPSRVFIFGESAGAASVSLHLVMRNSWGLFHRAGLESGSFSYWEVRKLNEADAQFQSIMKAAQCTTLMCLVNYDARSLVNIAMNLGPHRARGHCLFAPTVDGVELTDLPWNLLNSGVFPKGIQILQGFNHDEGTIDVNQVGIRPDIGEMSTILRFKLLGVAMKDIEHFFEIYKNHARDIPRTSKYYWMLVGLLTDIAFSCPDLRTARTLTELDDSSIVYMYEFDHVPTFEPPYWAGWPGVKGSSGVFHTAEIPYVFNVKNSTGGYYNISMNSEESLFADAVSVSWINFATTGKPNFRSIWPEFRLNENIEYINMPKPYFRRRKLQETDLETRCAFVSKIQSSLVQSSDQMKLQYKL